MKKMLLKRSSFEFAPTLLKISFGMSIRAMFILPIVVLYYQTKNMSVGDFFMLQAICSVVAFAIEIPTGYIGDVFDRKKVILSGVLMWLIGNVFIWLGNSFLYIAIGEMIFGVAIALMSGTRQAYLYDLLKSMGKQKNALKEEASFYSWEQWFLLFGCLIGGFLYDYNIHYPVILICIFTVIGFVMMMFLPSVKNVKKSEEKRDVWRDVKETVKYSLKGHEEVKWLIIYPAVLYVGTFTLFWVLQIQAKGFDIAVKYFGLVLVVNYVLKAIFSANTTKIIDKIGLKSCVVSFLILIIIACLGVFFSQLYSYTDYMCYVLLFISLLGVSFVHSIGKPLFTTMINDRVDSSQRATVLSVSSFAFRGMYTIIFFFMKFLIDGIGVYNAMLILAVFFLIGTIPLMRLIRLGILNEK